MKKIFSIFLIFIALTSVVGCVNTLNDPYKKVITTNNCTLIIKGEDITTEGYIHINEEDKYAEIPYTLIAKKLGATVQWHEYTKVTISYNNSEEIIDLTDVYFGILPPYGGGVTTVRKVINDEVVVDCDAVKQRIEGWFKVKILVDYENKIIEIV